MQGFKVVKSAWPRSCSRAAMENSGRGKSRGPGPGKFTPWGLKQKGIPRARACAFLMALPLESPLPHGSVSPSPQGPTSKRLNANFSPWGAMSIQAHPETALVGGVGGGMGALVAKHTAVRVGGSVRRSAPAPSGLGMSLRKGGKRKRKADPLEAPPAALPPPAPGPQERAGSALLRAQGPRAPRPRPALARGARGRLRRCSGGQPPLLARHRPTSPGPGLLPPRRPAPRHGSAPPRRPSPARPRPELSGRWRRGSPASVWLQPGFGPSSRRAFGAFRWSTEPNSQAWDLTRQLLMRKPHPPSLPFTLSPASGRMLSQDPQEVGNGSGGGGLVPDMLNEQIKNAIPRAGLPCGIF